MKVKKRRRRKGKRKHLRCYWSLRHFCRFVFKSFSAVLPTFIIISCRKRKWRSKRCCISKPGFMTEGLQRWCSRWSVPAKAGRHTRSSASLQLAAFGLTMMFDLCLSGRLTAMVTFTLKLGISILNGGNTLVQQVGCLRHAANIQWTALTSLTVILFQCRKCWTIWKKKEMLAFSKVYLD